MRIIISMFLCVGLVFSGIGDKFTINNENGSVAYFNVNSVGVVTFSSSIVNMATVFIDPATADIDVISTYTAAYISTATLLTSGTTWVLADSYITDGCITPRNIVIRGIVMESTTIINTTGSITGVVIVTGINARGENTTETFVLSTNTATGNVAFASIVSFAITVSAIVNDDSANVGLTMGTGTKIGLPNNINSTADVYNVSEAGSKVTNYVLNTSYNTIDFSSDPNGSNDYSVFYKTNGR